MNREMKAQAFLQETPWAAATRAPLAGDASNRRYERLMENGATAVFMDAPPDKGEDVRPFIAIAQYLKGLGLSAPAILAQDTDQGFLVIEDLGDDLYARVVARDPDMEDLLYKTATDALVALHQAEPPQLPAYDPQLMTSLAATAFTRYQAGITGAPADKDAAEFSALFQPLLEDLTQDAQVLIQRDYHAENLLWLPDRAGIARVGMLDFQDAMLGHPAYDLLSILQDARRDVPPSTEDKMIRHYLTQTGMDETAFRNAYAALGVQRNLRILGIFAKLSLDMGKTHYVGLIPRVWGLLQRDLDHPSMASVAQMIRDNLPEPSSDNLVHLIPK